MQSITLFPVHTNSLQQIIILALISMLLTSCARQPIAPESFEGKTIVLEKNVLALDPAQSEEIFIGIENKEYEPEIFSFFVSCITPNCDEQIVSQFFPTVTVEPQQKIAVPFLIAARDTAIVGTYHLLIAVKKGDVLIGEETLTITMTNTVEEKKQQLLETA